MLTGGPSSSFPLLSCQWAGPVGASGSPSRDRRSPAAAEQFDALLVSLPNGHGGCPYRLRTATGAVHFAFEQTGPLSVSEMGLLRKAGVGRLPSITAYLVGPVGASGSPSRARGSPAALNSSGRCRLRVRTVRGAVLFACEQSGALSISRLNRPGRCPFVLSIAAQPVRLCFQSPRNLAACDVRCRVGSPTGWAISGRGRSETPAAVCCSKQSGSLPRGAVDSTVSRRRKEVGNYARDNSAAWG